MFFFSFIYLYFFHRAFDIFVIEHLILSQPFWQKEKIKERKRTHIQFKILKKYVTEIYHVNFKNPIEIKHLSFKQKANYNWIGHAEKKETLVIITEESCNILGSFSICQHWWNAENVKLIKTEMRWTLEKGKVIHFCSQTNSQMIETKFSEKLSYDFKFGQL